MISDRNPYDKLKTSENTMQYDVIVTRGKKILQESLV